MPLHISEIGVRLAVGDGETPVPETNPADAGSPPAPSPQQRESFVAACVRRVVAALRNMTAR